MKLIRIFIIILFSISSIFLVKWAVQPDLSPVWTGFGKYDETVDGPRSKTLWDWLDLLIIPIVIGVIAWIFKEIEKEKAEKSEEERAQNETLDSFIKVMTELIIKHKLTSKESSFETKSIARTRINLALSILNGSRKGQVLQFIYESGLINKNPKINILGGDLTNAILDGIVLSQAEIKGAYFNNASLKNSNLNETNFTGCDFTKANLSNSLVKNANFSYSNLSSAILKNMDLTSINFEGADLSNADLRGSNIKADQIKSIFKKNKLKITKSKIQ